MAATVLARFLLVVYGLGLAGCASTILPIYEVNGQQREWAQMQVRQAHIPAPRLTPDVDWLPTLDRVVARMWPAALVVCQETFSHGCPESLQSMRPTVITDDMSVNAFARRDGVLGFNGGLIRVAGVDDEIAMVVGHEIAHIMLGHNQKQESNETMGGLLGLAVGLGVAYDLAPHTDSDVLADIVSGSTQAAAQVGRLAYSPEMELEADILSAYMLHEAGYDLDLAKNFFIRTQRLGVAAGPDKALSVVGFLGTHPSDDRRLAHWALVASRAKSGLRPGQ